MQELIQSWIKDSNTRNFIMGVAGVGLLYYIYRGHDGHERIHRFFKATLILIFIAVVSALLYGFLK